MCSFLFFHFFLKKMWKQNYSKTIEISLVHSKLTPSILKLNLKLSLSMFRNEKYTWIKISICFVNSPCLLWWMVILSHDNGHRMIFVIFWVNCLKYLHLYLSWDIFVSLSLFLGASYWLNYSYGETHTFFWHKNVFFPKLNLSLWK